MTFLEGTIFGVNSYGTSTYGAPPNDEYNVQPFTAVATSYTQVYVSWSNPAGDWEEFLLVSNRSGYPVSPDDGTVLVDTTSNTTGYYNDLISATGWYYYTIFVMDDEGDWQNCGNASALAVSSYGNQGYLWDHTPEWYKSLQDNTAGYNPDNFNNNPKLYLRAGNKVDNLDLWQFYGVLGWGLDIVQTQIDTTFDGYDPATMNFDRLGLLASEMGTELERSVPAQTSRNLVGNLSLLYRERGLPEGIEEMVGLVIGWQADITVGPNLMLSEDQADFTNPVIPQWDPTVRYVSADNDPYVGIDDHVYYQGYSYKVISLGEGGPGAAYGPDQAPPNSGSSNTWWEQSATIYSDGVEPNTQLVRSDTGNIGTWEAYDSSGDPLTVLESTHIGRGVTDPLDPDSQESNALGVENTTSGTDDILLRSVPYYLDGGDTYDRELSLQSIVPLPYATATFDPTYAYQTGDLVNFAGIVYQAIRPTSRYPTSADWNAIGYDRRPRVCMSFYTHGRFAGGGSPTNLITPYVAAFSGAGDFLYEMDLTPSLYTNVAFDSFNALGEFDAETRVFDFGGLTWTNVLNDWSQGWDWDNCGFVFPTVPGTSWALTDSGISDGNIGVTYITSGTWEMGIVFRWSSTDTGSEAYYYWVASQSELLKVDGGETTVVATYPSPASDGDRLTVALDGTSITVALNGVTVASTTDSFNETETYHGIIAL